MSQKQMNLVRLLYAIIYATVKNALNYLTDTLNRWEQYFLIVIRMATKGEYSAPVSIIIAGIVWVICTPIYVNEIQNTNTTGWDFTGSSGAITLFQFMPFVFIAGGLVWIVRKVLD